MTHSNIIVEKTPDAASAAAARLCKEIVTEAVHQRGLCHLALAGGTTPRITYMHLADHVTTDQVPWSKVEVFFGDERDVPQDDVESNYAMAQRTLLDHMPIDWSRVHAMRADAGDLDAASWEYERIIRDIVGNDSKHIPQFDMIMLGLGGDGHAASLFPNCPSLEEAHRLVVSCHIPILGRNRMTFTFPLINAARNVLFLITGDDKAAVVKRVFQDHDQSLPAARISPPHGTINIVLDAAAARLL
ncbi:MAG: 6-phosphogluconolactonase [Phycisphaerae bacterium]|nr:6-phosphogluconolactonase [Phycisphaerae bacterium]